MTRVSISTALLLSALLGVNFQRDQHVRADAATATAYVAVDSKQEEPTFVPFEIPEEAVDNVEQPAPRPQVPVEVKPNPAVQKTKTTTSICRNGICTRPARVGLFRRIFSRITLWRR